MTPATTKAALHTACLLEVTARKPGNVHPLAAFTDCDWQTFADSAEAIAPVLAGAAARSLGESILRAAEATNDRVGRNTNLGMILLLAPLAAVPMDGDLRRGIGGVLRSTTIDDCRLVYEAIRLARPGGLGTSDSEDVAAVPTVSLVEAMRMAADRDDVAKQYANDFADVFQLAERFDAGDLPALERQIVTAHVERIAAVSDTLIRRKCGDVIAGEAARRAGELVAVGRAFSPSERPFNVPSLPDGLKARPTELKEFDAWLRADGNRRNPGTTADLIAAALFVAIREGRLRCFDAAEIVAYADALRSAKRDQSRDRQGALADDPAPKNAP